MRKILCSIQQGAIAATLVPQLETALRNEYAEHFGASAAPFVIWCEVPRGQAYTEGRLSDVSWLMVEVADGLDQVAREKAMLAMAAAFAGVAGVPVEKLMVTLCDSALFDEYLAANRNRMRALARAWFTVKMLVGVLVSRRRDGFASIGVNY